MDGSSTSTAPVRVTASIPVGTPGKHRGFLTIPHSRDESAWGSIQMPIISIANGEGPTLLFTAGSHGDEYEGQIALMKAAQWLEPEMIRGRVILLPSLNHPAVCSATRLSPIDGLNMNRVFPGQRDGTVTQMIAHYVYSELLPLVDVVVDLHSGGKTLEFVPSVIMHALPDSDLHARTLAALKAFDAPAAAILTELDSEGMLDTAVETLGKVFISTELGGAGTATASSVAVAERGVHNLLRHFDVLQEDRQSDHRGRAEPGRILHTPEGGAFVISRDAGILEMLVDLGDEVVAGQAICQVHHFEDVDRPPSVYRSAIDGILWCRHVPGLVARGDCVAVIASDYPQS
ncbi:succinylglutamate desuccinylase/aspartoacylase domain-containing protein [Aquibaculum arenosum]|uniref:Succinylglutamate desuccinylase/aspartoacylase family protein n=1 Tax=Aquibaculum arenosum TaxID=3032591 RepID=A0ABT5YNL2_9PROT|nr:succinylglutamate desuccinylase/aspartoacylase family protein [Fodinicurvata sp. CAU 1616]MDF2096561.1 succinylglutamate desuccinylase/aspartoacylase family protein [Fodinicurvata sp. CAU 1616]